MPQHHVVYIHLLRDLKDGSTRELYASRDAETVEGIEALVASDDLLVAVLNQLESPVPDDGKVLVIEKDDVFDVSEAEVKAIIDKIITEQIMKLTGRVE